MLHAFGEDEREAAEGDGDMMMPFHHPPRRLALLGVEAIVLSHLHAAEAGPRRDVTTRALAPRDAAKRGHAELRSEVLGADGFSLAPLLRIEAPDR